MAAVPFLCEGSDFRSVVVRWVGVAEEDVVAVWELEEDLAGEGVARRDGRGGRGGQDRADVPQSGLLGGALDPGRGRADEPVRRERFRGRQRVQQDQDVGFGAQVSGSRAASSARTVPTRCAPPCTQQGQDDRGSAVGFFFRLVLAAFLDVGHERLPADRHHVTSGEGKA